MFLPNKLKEIRRERNFTTVQLGTLIGVCPSAITNWEKGTRTPNAEKIAQLASILSCTADELLGIDHSAGEGETI